MMLNIFFPVLIYYLYIFFSELSFEGFFPNFWIALCVFLLLKSESSFYILDIGPLSYVWLANIFS